MVPRYWLYLLIQKTNLVDFIPFQSIVFSVHSIAFICTIQSLCALSQRMHTAHCPLMVSMALSFLCSRFSENGKIRNHWYRVSVCARVHRKTLSGRMKCGCMRFLMASRSAMDGWYLGHSVMYAKWDAAAAAARNGGGLLLLFVFLYCSQCIGYLVNTWCRQRNSLSLSASLSSFQSIFREKRNCFSTEHASLACQSAKQIIQ